MSSWNVAIIYENRVRADTTGYYCWRALRQLVRTTHLLPAQLPSLRGDEFDLYINIDDGLSYALPDHLRPMAVWAIDTHIQPQRIVDRCASADHVFAAQQNGVALLREAGLPVAGWLPLACDPQVHRPHALAKALDVAFVGHFNHPRRRHLVSTIGQRHPRSYLGQALFEDMARHYSRAKIGFNCSHNNDVNMRVFEVTACGSMLLTDAIQHSGLDRLFDQGKELVTYADDGELFEKIKYYLAHERERERTARAGHARTTSHHTYRHRMITLLKEVESRAAQSSVHRLPAPVISPVKLRESSPGDPVRVGCVLAIKDRPLDMLDRCLRSYQTQTRRPDDCLLLDYGSDASLADSYAQLCQALGWRYARVNPQPNQWYLSAAYNYAVELLRDDIDVVFKSDADMILSATAVEQAAKLGHSSLAVFSNILTTTAETQWPQETNETHDARALIQMLAPLQLMESDGTVAFPRDWFQRIGGYDLGFVSWGFEDTDLRSRAAQSIGVTENTDVLLIHQWHERAVDPQAARDNHLLYLTMRHRGQLVRNCGRPILLEWETWLAPASGTPGALGAPEALESPPDVASIAPSAVAASIVIPVLNRVDLTKMCVESVMRHTRIPFEFVFVNNGSNDETDAYLRGLAHPRRTIIRNDRNRGFPAAVNQGIQASRGSFIVLLNNDVVVTEGWLERMIAVMEARPAVGLVGPCTNAASGPQVVEANYENVAQLDAFARQWADKHHGLEEVDRLVGFCLVCRRDLFDRIGLLDESFGIGTFEDDDLCLRALQAGYKALIDRSVFIHHFGSQTFHTLGIDLQAHLNRNQQRFLAKWDRVLQQRGIIPSNDENPQPARPRLSLCMIVRDSSRTLGAALASIKSWVDELIVVDTGSVDDTVEIARRHGAQVHHFPWCDDFAAARNESLKHASGQWVFWMDSDDTIDEANGQRLRALAHVDHPDDVMGFVIKVRCPGRASHGGDAFVAVDHIKLIRNRPELRFEGRIHEQILPAIRRMDGTVKWTDLYVVHSGSDNSSKARQHKYDRDLRLLELDLKDRPDHPFVLFNFGMTFSDMGRHDDAVQWLKQSIEQADPQESHVRKAYALLASSLAGLERLDEASAACDAGLAHYPDDLELLFLKGNITHQAGELSQAEAAFRKILEQRDHPYFASLDTGIRDFKTRHNLAVVLVDAGRFDEAQVQWQRVIEAYPAFRPAWQGLAQLLIARGALDDAEQLAAAMEGHASLRTERELLLAELDRLRGLLDACKGRLLKLLDTEPAAIEVHRAWTQFAFDHEEPQAALEALLQLQALDPDDASAYHNAGSVYLRLGKRQEAAASYRKALQLRPAHRLTEQMLLRALEHAGA